MRDPVSCCVRSTGRTPLPSLVWAHQSTWPQKSSWVTANMMQRWAAHAGWPEVQKLSLPPLTGRCGLQKADIWSCGVILYAMLFGKYPFDAQQRNFARHIVNAHYSIPQVTALCNAAAALHRRRCQLICHD